MNAKDLQVWRERAGLTQQQVADRLGVTRATIQNWEGGVTPIPRTVDMSCEVLEARLRQENPDFGPVTLIYSDAPMFVRAYGPRRKPAMMQQEPYSTNTAALARVQQLWGRDDFNNPLIIEESGTPVWNVVELGRVVDRSDSGAPTLVNILKRIADFVRTNSANFVRSGRESPSLEGIAKRRRDVEEQANQLERIAGSTLEEIVHEQLQIEKVFASLPALSTRAPNALVLNVYEALVVFEQYPAGDI